MRFCRIVDRLYDAVPSRAFRGWLIRSHMERCEFCQAGLVGRGAARSLFVAPEDFGAADRLWAKIGPSVTARGPQPSEHAAAPRLRLAWAAGAVSLFVTAVVGFWLLSGIRTAGTGPGTGAVPAADRFQMDYVRVGGADARTFVYQPNDSEMIIVWAEPEI